MSLVKLVYHARDFLNIISEKGCRVAKNVEQNASKPFDADIYVPLTLHTNAYPYFPVKIYQINVKK